MEWKDLSNNAKNVLEWLENPYSGVLTTLKIEKGKHFTIDGYDVDVLISDELYNEIVQYAKEDSFTMYSESNGVLHCRLIHKFFGE